MAAKPPRGGSTAALALLAGLTLLTSFAPSAGAIGPSIQLSVSPQTVTGTPGPDSPGEANFSGFVELFTNPVGQATIAVEISSQLGWAISPPGFSWRTTSAGRFPFEFVVEVPPNATAEISDSIDVTASYRVGGVAVQQESTSVHAVAGGYYGGVAKRITPAAPMDVGRTYVIEFDVRNTGNAPATFTFAWADEALMDKLRANTPLPNGLSLGAFSNETAQFFLTPGSTTPAGEYKVPVRVEIKDRTARVTGYANFTVDVEVVNLPIYQGFLPNWDLRAPYTLAGFAAVFLLIWFGFHVLFALLAARKLDPKGKARFPRALSARIRRSLLVRAVRGLLGKVPRGRARRVKRPEEVRGLARSRPERGR